MSVEIPVYLRGRKSAVAIVDEADAHLADYLWTLSGGYAVRTVRRHERQLSTSMHRQICELSRGDTRVIHHVNETKLDNRRENLAVFASMSEGNGQPHPQRDVAQREGYDLYLARFLPHVLERRRNKSVAA